MNETEIKDRRAHTRHRTALELQGTPEDGGIVARMVARNLSIGGMYCASAVDFPEMTRLAVRLMLPLPGDNAGVTQPLDIEAVVVRREELTGSGGTPRYELGLYFTQIEPQARQQLEYFIARQA